MCVSSCRGKFERWLELGKSDKLSKVEEVSNPLPNIYAEAKEGSKKFQEVKRLLFKVRIINEIRNLHPFIVRHLKMQSWGTG